MTILLAGTPHTTVMIANALVDSGHTIVGVLCPFPKPAGRKKIITASKLEMWAKDRSIRVCNVNKEVLSDNAFVDTLPHAELLIVADFGYLIPARVLAFCSLGAYNLHPSLLPRWRGATPVPFTLLFGDVETGMSIIRMNEKFDMGDVVMQERVLVEPHDTTPILLERCFAAGARMIVTLLPRIAAGTVQPIPQPAQSPAPITRKFTKEDGYVPLEALRAAMDGVEFGEVAVKLLDEYALPHTAQYIDQMVRALTPWPGVWTMKDGKRVKVVETGTTKTNTLEINKILIEGLTSQQTNSFQIKKIIS